MNNAVPAHLAPASRLLEILQSSLGGATQLRYGNECLHVAYSTTASNVAECLRTAGAEIEGSVNLPGGDDVHFGCMDGAHFLIQSQNRVSMNPATSVQIYASTGKEAVRSARLDAIYRTVDTLLASHTSKDGALLGYIARRLTDQTDAGSTQHFVASVAELVTDHLKSSLPPLDPALTVRG